mgnify:CR=1 FL=1
MAEVMRYVPTTSPIAIIIAQKGAMHIVCVTSASISVGVRSFGMTPPILNELVYSQICF